MPHQIPVEFDGPGSGIGPLTWGQRQVWRVVRAQGSSEFLGGTREVPSGTTVADVAAALRFAMSRHESLRTLLVFDGDGEPRQRVHESGTTSLDVVEAGDADPAAVADQTRIRYQTTDFDYAHEWPVRMAVICRHGTPTHTVAVYSHLAVDAGGLDALLADLASMTDPPPLTATRPLEQARQQTTPTARRQADAGLRHWERVLRTAAPRRFGESTDRREPRYWRMRYTSPAADRAMRSVAARHGCDTSPVLLAAYATALVRTVGTNPVVLQIAVSNRFRPGFADSVSTLAQASPCLIDVADASFDETVGRAWQAAMSTYLNAYYDPNERAALVEAVHADRGTEIDLGCYFNDRRDTDRPAAPVPAAEILAAVPAGRLAWGEHTAVPQPKLYLNVDDVPDGVAFGMLADTHHVCPADMEAIVRTLEAVVVAAAVGERTAV
ncbi:MAG TPA: condensation domain-containing protein [Pseudonocardiaceae bacterium]|nr:condensation domain-containing protein [Pseudonocardiaceae bacterium]